MAQDLFEKLKYAPKDELESYLITAHITGGLSAVIGVTSIFLTLMFTNIMTIIATFCILHLFGNIAVAATNIKAYIRSLLSTKFNDK
jgi:hypothetical protein